MNNTPIIKFGVDPDGPDAREPDAFQFIACSNAGQAFPIRRGMDELGASIPPATRYGLR